ncbi:MAG: GNAT family N-acetyltransferase [Saprospiraceae bacterium]
MDIQIRKVKETDIESIHSLVRELAEYEKGLHKLTTTSESFLHDFRDKIFDAFVAETEGKVVGMALYFMAFSTWRGRMLYLEDFVVRQTERGSGIGKLLFDAFLDEAKRQEVSLVKWQVLDWNEPAINFYKKYDVEFDDEWLDCKIYLKE